MSNSLIVPNHIAAKTRDELRRKLLEVNMLEGGKVNVISIYFDTAAKEHVCWYMPLKLLRLAAKRGV